MLRVFTNGPGDLWSNAGKVVAPSPTPWCNSY